ncbi:hypothetical protein CPAST_c05850 [Clostridium pasteurianum DSM 525 = ATCC 6013]|uniref:DUF2207 domain-containing protein n=2 Tax=Clostridium pasteurianum TaxID=1501 RepID=A0A0H3J6T5_CLOPA|nr:DUF2207 domain-containing protein [Clostridium pasteurianum]AJA46685.1 hypothetical protein CPAST_c05850 [Clostridium pasteurianum DSM 525 = ATCC 6013]AJA50673.1 hypothetical protein CLPA_c05850 [Clostridium pasteurianum DSM 525 = ATCC 6013]AOZ74092.1 hypothetical protein AQ983_02810 [Clostridium pasteurianum DSM 525 = ATCC 6013]AOZ77889.1 hypothetical protein AQ984_02810 [Clostridium pasteurianum]ELP61251.1 hypothetical protein F502_02310 [Clostridium pasteurianum DSM 525 = ATCC 6013]
MKKFLLCFCVLVLTFSIHSLKVLAADGISLSQFNVETTLKEDGSIDMEELLTYNFKDKYNGAYREISTKNTDGIYNIKVWFLSKDGEEIPLREVSNAKNGDNNVFEVLKENSTLYRIKIYSPSNNEEKTFKITYTMKNVAVKYKDTGEFFYTYWSDYNETEIDNFKIHINIASNTENENIKAYYHGISAGNMSIENGSVYYTFPHVNSKELVETRVLFPAELISLSTNTRDENGLNRILGEEADYREEQQQKIAKAALMKKVFDYIDIILGAISIIAMLIIWRGFKNNSQEVYSIYSPPEIPEECTPAVAAYLVNRIANGRTIYATILDLWRKGYLNIEKIDTENSKDKSNFLLKKIKRLDKSLLKHEKYFMDWIFKTLGDGNSVSTAQVKKSSFYYAFQEWVKLIREEIKARNYYDKKATSKGIALIIAASVFIVISIISLVFHAYFGAFSLTISVFMLIYGIACCVKKTPYGQSKYNDWIKFKKYIKDVDFNYNDNMNRDYVEKYIPYAEALNMNKNSMIKLKNVFDNPSQDMGWIYYYLLFDNINLKRNEQFNYYIYNSFGTGSYGSSDASSGGGGSSAGGGGAGGF